jgi:hypothetical protein
VDSFSGELVPYDNFLRFYSVCLFSKFPYKLDINTIRTIRLSKRVYRVRVRDSGYRGWRVWRVCPKSPETRDPSARDPSARDLGWLAPIMPRVANGPRRQATRLTRRLDRFTGALGLRAAQLRPTDLL